MKDLAKYKLTAKIYRKHWKLQVRRTAEARIRAEAFKEILLALINTREKL